MATISVFLPGESQGQGSLVGCCLCGCTESDTTEATQQQQQQHPVAMTLFVEKTGLSPFYYSGHLGSPIIAAPLLKSDDQEYKDLFWMLSLFHLYVCLYLFQSTLYLITVTFYVLKLGTCLFLFFFFLLDILSLINYSMNFFRSVCQFLQKRQLEYFL